MLTVKIIVVDKTRSPFLKDGEVHYLERLRRYARTEWIEVKGAKIRKGTPPERVMSAEAEAITRRLVAQDHIIALDRTGKSCGSEALAARIEELATGQHTPAFVIGGPLGLSKPLLRAAHERLSLSRLTLTHEMSRLVLLEQLYRACTIMHNEHYHK